MFCLIIKEVKLTLNGIEATLKNLMPDEQIVIRVGKRTVVLRASQKHSVPVQDCRIAFEADRDIGIFREPRIDATANKYVEKSQE